MYLRFEHVSLPVAAAMPSRKLRPLYIRARLVRQRRYSVWEVDVGAPTTRMHTSFHVSSMRPYHRTKKQAGGTLGSALGPDGRVVTAAEAEKMLEQAAERQSKEYVVEQVMRHRKKGKKLEYLCSWKGFPLSECSWVREEDLSAPRLVKEYHERTARKIAYLNGEEANFPTKYNQQPEAGTAKLASRKENQVGAVSHVRESSDELGPAWAHDEYIFSRSDVPTAALDSWLCSLEQTLHVGAIADCSTPQERLQRQLRKGERQRQRRIRKAPKQPVPAPRDRHSDAHTAPPDIETKMEAVAHARALAATRAQAARVGRSLPDEPGSGEFNYQLKRIWNEVRSSVKRAGKNVEARRSIWRRIAEEARRAASQEPRSATSLRQPFPGRMPDKPARRTHKGRIQENRSGRGKR